MSSGMSTGAGSVPSRPSIMHAAKINGRLLCPLFEIEESSGSEPRREQVRRAYNECSS